MKIKPVGGTHFHMNCFTLRIVLILRQKATRKWRIAQPRSRVFSQGREKSLGTRLAYFSVLSGKSHKQFVFHCIDRLFEIAPELKDLFPFGDDFTKPQFTTHALNIMNAIDFTVQYLDNPDVLIPKLKELGEMHAVFELTVKEFQVSLLLGRPVHTSLSKQKPRVAPWNLGCFIGLRPY